MDGFEKGPEIMEITNQPETVGELPHSLPATSEWDSLSDVPFAGGGSDASATQDANWDSLSDVPFAGDTN